MRLVTTTHGTVYRLARPPVPFIPQGLLMASPLERNEAVREARYVLQCGTTRRKGGACVYVNPLVDVLP